MAESSDERAARLAAALRENLKKRKARARGAEVLRYDGAGDPPGAETDLGSAGRTVR